MKLFVSITGDYPNIGDAFIRRQAVDWVRFAGTALVYARDAPDVWVEQVGVTQADEVLKSGRLQWLRAIVRQRRAVVAFEPGEIKLDLRALPRELAFLLMALIVRLRGGVVLLPPRAIAGHHPLTLTVHRQLCRISTVALWRDAASMKLANAGDLVPDIGFSGNSRVGRPDSERRTLLVSLRGRRPVPPAAWFDGLKQFANTRGLKIVTMSQVREDENRSAEVAQLLGGQHLVWETDDIDHERKLRELYDQSLMVVSDRLHVLIVSSLSGVVPTEVVAKPVPKVRTHFEQIEYSDLTLDCSDKNAIEIAAFLSAQADRRIELVAAVKGAGEVLARYATALRAAAGGG